MTLYDKKWGEIISICSGYRNSRMNNEKRNIVNNFMITASLHEAIDLVFQRLTLTQK